VTGDVHLYRYIYIYRERERERERGREGGREGGRENLIIPCMMQSRNGGQLTETCFKTKTKKMFKCIPRTSSHLKPLQTKEKNGGRKKRKKGGVYPVQAASPNPCKPKEEETLVPETHTAICKRTVMIHPKHTPAVRACFQTTGSSWCAS
jgi:hypothetical protein